MNSFLRQSPLNNIGVLEVDLFRGEMGVCISVSVRLTHCNCLT